MLDPSGDNHAQTLAPGLVRFDTGYLRQGHTACYIVYDHGRAAILDTGVGASVPGLLSAIADLGIALENVDWVIPTHVHLDHAGGAGALMQALPNARLGVHPSGAEHMIDPARLESGVRALYGDAFFDREYAPLTPVPADRIDILEDGASVRVGARIIEVLHTPGHAWHHLSLLDTASGILVAGDAFGASYPGYINDRHTFVVPVVPPPQFNPQAYRATLQRICDVAPNAVAPAHFPLIHDVQGVAKQLDAMLTAAMQLAETADDVKTLERDLVSEWSRWLPGDSDQAQFNSDFGMDIWLTAEGLWLWREKQRKKKAANA